MPRLYLDFLDPRPAAEDDMHFENLLDSVLNGKIYDGNKKMAAILSLPNLISAIIRLG
ncbi:MAG: hypothetical protein K2Q33_08230 [Gammaproteobacteria bacterium]|nr:hypothetical protein [Gammaproteobacteria bacterium]